MRAAWLIATVVLASCGRESDPDPVLVGTQLGGQWRCGVLGYTGSPFCMHVGMCANVNVRNIHGEGMPAGSFEAAWTKITTLGDIDGEWTSTVIRVREVDPYNGRSPLGPWVEAPYSYGASGFTFPGVPSVSVVGLYPGEPVVCWRP